MKHLLLIDGHHLMYRAFYAVPRTLQTKSGELTNAVFGVASMFLTMLRVEQPDAVLFCFDAGSDTFRHQEHAEYKAGRAETPDEFYAQIPRIHECVSSFCVKEAADPGFEADDLLCSYARAAAADGMRVTIVTGDRDAFQVAAPNIRIAIPHKGYLAPEYLGPNEVFAKYGITPEQVPAYKGLSGDSSDNLPGVQGIGPKTASQLLQQYHTLEGIYEHLSDIRPAVRSKLERDREQAFFCQRMALLIESAPRTFTWDDLLVGTLDTSALQAFLQRMEFFSLLPRIRSLLATPYGQKLSPMAAVQDVFGDPDSPAEDASQLSLF